MEPSRPGNPNIVDRNRWQPLKLEVAIDQAGNLVDSEPEFIGPEWGSVEPFALREEALTIYQRDIRRNEFLVFEEGPSVDMRLEWARYRDAADQCSLSRIWGGIHPPADDIPGRLIGIEVGLDPFELADRFFRGTVD